MRIIIDADGCPKNVRDISLEIAQKNNIDLIMVVDINHQIYSEKAKVITVEQGQDSVDFKIKNILKKDDVAITQDYGLASMLIEKARGVLNPKGFRYTKLNMNSLMFKRHMGSKIRKSGGRIKGPSKRVKKNDKDFKRELQRLISKGKAL